MIRVLVVDDSAVVRRILEDELSRLPDIQVVATAADPFEARDLIAIHGPDVITLDIEMPKMDGLSFLERIMRSHPMPVVVVSSLTQGNNAAALRALALGAVEVVPKPGASWSVPDVAQRLARAIRAASVASLERLEARPPSPPVPGVAEGMAALLNRGNGGTPSTRMIVIGASTGGTRAVETLLAGLPADSPGMVVVLHMPAGFTKSYADRLDSILPLHVVEAEDGALVTPGTVLVAPGGYHLVMRKAGGRCTVHLRAGPPVHHQRPAVDVFFRSVARSVGGDAVGVLLTGMGADGAKGMLEMREAGSYTVAEHESTCVVYGMPRVAVELGAAVDVLPLGEIGEAVLKAARSGTDGVARTRTAATRPSPSRPPHRGGNREGVAP